MDGEEKRVIVAAYRKWGTEWGIVGPLVGPPGGVCKASESVLELREHIYYFNSTKLLSS